MQRRKLLIGMGSLAAGGSAAIGTGAFTSVNASRDVSVEVAGDKQAYLGIQKVNSGQNSAFVEKSDGSVSLDFSAADNDGSPLGSSGGDGFNSNATTQIDNLLAVTNQGTQEVGFYVDITAAGAGEDFITIIATNDMGAGSNVLSDNVAYDGGDDTTVDPVELSTGQSIFLHLVADTDKQKSNSFEGTVTFVADEAIKNQEDITS